MVRLPDLSVRNPVGTANAYPTGLVQIEESAFIRHPTFLPPAGR